MTIGVQHLIWLVPSTFVLGFFLCDLIHDFAEHKRAIREIEESYARAVEKLKAQEAEPTPAGCDDVENWELEGEFWKGFCPACRGFHGQGKCPWKWRVL